MDIIRRALRRLIPKARRETVYLVFGGQRYYGSGGGYDLLLSTPDIDEAVPFAGSAIGKRMVLAGDDSEYMPEERVEWTHVLDAREGKILAKFGEKPYGGGAMVAELRDPDQPEVAAFGVSPLDNPEYKEAQRQLNEQYRSMIDTMAGRNQTGSKVSYMPISKSKMEGR